MSILLWRNCVIIVPFLVFFNVSCWAVDSLQILFVGNIDGKLATWTSLECIKPTTIWQTPELLRLLSKQVVSTFKIGVGNFVSPKDPVSILLVGKAEESFLNLLKLDFSVLGPGELSLFKYFKRLPEPYYSHIWSNVEVSEKRREFTNYKIINWKGKRIGIGGIISLEYLQDSPIRNQEGYTFEDPLKTINRVKFEFPEVDFRIFVFHGPKSELNLLADRIDRNTRFLWIPSPSDFASTQYLHSNITHPSIWIMPVGFKGFLCVNIEIREGGRWEEKVRRINFEPGTLARVPKEFMILAEALYKRLAEPLYIIRFDKLPAYTPYIFRPAVHAKLVKEFIRSDFAIIYLDDEILKQERVLTNGFVVSSIRPDFLREYLLSGHELKEFLTFLYRSGKLRHCGFAGGKLEFLGHNLAKFYFRKELIDDKTKFRITLNEKLFLDGEIKQWLSEPRKAGKFGWTLLDAWLVQLPKIGYDFKIWQDE